MTACIETGLASAGFSTRTQSIHSPALRGQEINMKDALFALCGASGGQQGNDLGCDPRSCTRTACLTDLLILVCDDATISHPVQGPRR